VLTYSFIEELTGGYGASTFEKFIAAEDAIDDEVSTLLIWYT
jgi:hypothetical protein